jgi:MinD superfamily P-loop ATPase
MKIAIASGKGGTGKTFVATNLFNALIHKGISVTLVDCDAEAPNAAAFFPGKIISEEDVTQQIPVIDTEKCTFCGKCYEFCNYNAIFYLPPMKVIKVLDELCHSCGACSYACNFGAITEKPHIIGKVFSFETSSNSGIIEARTEIGAMTPVPVIKAAIAKSSNKNDITIFDSPPGTSCPFIHTVSNADYVILVTEPTPFGVSDLKQSVETLKQLEKPFGVIVNRTGIGDEAVYQYLNQNKIPLLLKIPFNRQIARHYSLGKIAGDYLPELADQLTIVFNSIFQNDANSHYQR